MILLTCACFTSS